MMEELNEEHLTGFMKPPPAFIWAHFHVNPKHSLIQKQKKQKRNMASDTRRES